MKTLFFLFVITSTINGYTQVILFDTITQSTFEIDTFKLKAEITLKKMLLDSVRQGSNFRIYEAAHRVLEYSYTGHDEQFEGLNNKLTRCLTYYYEEIDVETGEVLIPWELRFIIDEKGELIFDVLQNSFGIVIIETKEGKI